MENTIAIPIAIPIAITVAIPIAIAITAWMYSGVSSKFTPPSGVWGTRNDK
ncbi:MAG TPA: hypothetical protein PLI09_23365 [Candidatus Hydrogenedentes bacterium]|nr:hypothetical protein [Candidatus Hydrogenedentota bacterium]